MNRPGSQTFDVSVYALLSAVLAILVVFVVETVNSITFTEDCLLYLSVFLTLDRVMLYRMR